MRSLLLLIGFAMLPTGLVRAEPSFAELNRVLTDRVAIPAYERMAKDMSGLHGATQAFCGKPEQDGLREVKNAFDLAMDAWQRAHPIAFGPVTWDGRVSRIEFWPDKRGTAARQVAAALRDQDPELISKGGLQGKSVALQNMATFERLVFDRGERMASESAAPEDRYACVFASAIALFQSELATEILNDWTEPGGFRKIVITAAGGNEHFQDADEVAAQFLKSVTGALDMAIQLKLERPLGENIGKARPKSAESWRSSRSLDNLVANLETARAPYIAPGGFGDRLSAVGSGPLDAGLRRSLEKVIETARSMPVPLHAAVADEAARPSIEALLEQLKALRVLIVGPVADEIGLVIGFNSMDGD